MRINVERELAGRTLAQRLYRGLVWVAAIALALSITVGLSVAALAPAPISVIFEIFTPAIITAVLLVAGVVAHRQGREKGAVGLILGAIAVLPLCLQAAKLGLV